MSRPTWDEYGLALAATVAARADCTRRQVGAVLLAPDGRVVATGYNGAPAGEPGCASAGACPRGRMTHEEAAPLAGYEASACIAVHAELNACLYAGRERAQGCTLYVTDPPCYLCRTVIAAAGVARVVVAAAPRRHGATTRPAAA